MSEGSREPRKPENPPPSVKKPAKRKPRVRDWEPLGTVRDSFYEQIKQDERR